MNSQAELTVKRIGAALALRHRYLVDPTNPSHCMKAIDEFSRSGTESITLPAKEDEYLDLAKSGTCTLSILHNTAQADVQIPREKIVQSAHMIISHCSLDGEVAGWNYIRTEQETIGIVTVGERLQPTYNPTVDWWEETETQVGKYKITRTFPNDGDNLGARVYEEELIFILDSMRKKFKESAKRSKVEFKFKTYMEKDEKWFHEVEITYEAERQVGDVEMDDLTLLRIFWEALINPNMEFPKYAKVVVEKGGDKVGEFIIKAGENSDGGGARLITPSTHSSDMQAAPVFQLAEQAIGIWNHWPRKI